MAGWNNYQWWNQSNKTPILGIEYFGLPYEYLDQYYSKIINEFNNMSSGTITHEELDAAKSKRINKWINSTYSTEGFNSFIQFYYNKNGYSLAKIKNMFDEINAVTLEEVNAAAKRIYNPDNFIMVIEGAKDSCSVLLDQLEDVEYFDIFDEPNKK